MNDRSMRDLNLLLRFVLELLVLLALFLWGVSVTDVLPLQVLLGIGAPAVAMLVWGMFVSPRASRRLPDPQRLVVEVVIFGAGALALAATGRLLPGLLLAAAAALSLFLMWSWGQRGL